MATIHIMLRDTDSGLVDVETTIAEGWDKDSNALALAGRVSQFLSEIAQQQGPTESRAGLELVSA